MRAPLDADATLDALDAFVDAAAADAVEVAVLARAGEYTRFAGDTVHQPQDVTEVQYLVRAVVDGHAVRAGTTVLGGVPAAIAATARAARERAVGAGRTGTVELAPPQPEPSARALWFDDVLAFDAAARVTAAGRAMHAAAGAGGEAAGMFGRALTQQLVLTTTGVRRQTVATEAQGSVTVGVGDGTAHWIDLGRSSERLALDASVERAIGEAVASRGRSEIPAGRYDVVLGPEAVGELVQFLPDLGFSGELAADGIGVCARHAGEQLAAPDVDVADDAAADVGLPIGFDLEGVSKRRVPFFTNGRVGDPVTDLATAARLGRPSTGHAHVAREEIPAPQAANLVVTAGSATESELIAAVERGVYVQRFWYTRLVDRTLGTITGVTRDACFTITDGRLDRPVAGTRFTHSVLDALAHVVGVGRERRSQPIMNVWNGAASAPALRLTGFRLGATPLPELPDVPDGDR